MSLGGDAPEPEISEASREGARIAAENWNTFVTRFAPVQDRLLKITGDRQEFMNRQIGKANAEAATASGLTPDNVSADAIRTGKIAGAGDVMERANLFRRGLASAYSTAEPAAFERDLRGKLKVAAIGRGLQDSAILSNADLGRTTTALEIERGQRALAKKYGLIEGAFTGLGAYAGTTGLFTGGAPTGGAPT